MSSKAPTPTQGFHDATRRHLLEAAAEVFAEVGFRAATVRQICEQAGANIAAVNYHFGDKEELYKAVLKDTYVCAIEKYPADFSLPPRATPEQRLRAFVHSFFLRLFSEGPSARPGKLMAREMVEPTSALDVIVKEGMRSMASVLLSIMNDLLGCRVNDETKRLCAMSVVSQVLFYKHCGPVVTRMFPDMKFDEAALEQLSEHVTRFSLAAIKNLAKKTAR